MIKDLELCFAKDLKLEDFSGGVVGDPIDLGAEGQLRGRQSFVLVDCLDDTTATGDPAIAFALEFSEDADFTAPVKVPLSLPPVTKEDMAKGKCVIARSPLYSLRYVRFLMESDVEIACMCVDVGFVMDPQTNG